MIAVAAANPFPGLRAFEADQADLFFGRDEQIEELLVRLERTRFLAVLGASGSGKSSLVRAGLVPALQRGYFGGANWRSVLFRPGGYPITEFAAALSDVFLRPQPEILSTLRGSSLGLVDFSRQYLQPAQSLLIVIDQFEELIRYRKDAGGGGAREESAAFVKLLLAATGHSELTPPDSDDLPIYVVLTMRSDFLGKCSQFRGLPEAMNDSQYLVPRMSREQRREAIEGPIGMAGGRITPQLVQRLLNDVGDSPDQLPVLQHALMRTWEQSSEERQQGKPIDLPTYESVGRMERALNLDAERAFAELGGDSKLEAIARRIFQSLVEPGAEDEATRRPSLLSELVAATGAENGKVREVIDVFHRAGFLTLSHDVDPVVDISHESLIRLWDRLNGWVKEETESAEIYLRLATSASKTMALYRDPELTQALRWKKREDPNAAWAGRYSSRDPEAFTRAMDFLSHSLAAHRREQWVRRGAIFGLCVLSLALTGVAFVAWTNAREARKNARTAEQSAKDADSQRAEAQKEREEAVQGRLQAEKEKREADEQRKATQKAGLEAERQRASALLARDRAQTERIRADQMKNDADNARAEAEWQRADAERQRAIVGSEHAEALARDLITKALRLLKEVPSKLETSTLLSIQSLRLKSLYENDQSTRELLGLLPRAVSEFPARASVQALSFSPDGHYLATASEDGTAWLFDTVTATGASRLSQEGSVRAIALGPDGRLPTTASDDNTARILEILSQNEILGVRPAVVFSPNGHYLAIGSGDGTAHVFEIATRKEVYNVTRPSAVNVMSFSPDGRSVAIGNEDGVVRILDSTTGREISSASKLGRVSGVFFSPDGEHVATTSRDKTACVFDKATGKIIARREYVNSAAFSPDGRFLITGSEDGTSRVFEVATAEEKWQIRHVAPVRIVAFSPDGRFIITGGDDRTAGLFSFPEGHEVSRLVHQGSVIAVAFSPDGRAATGSADGIARVFASGEENKFGVTHGADRAVALSPDGSHLANASSVSPLIDLIDLDKREKVSLRLDWPPVAVAFSPDGSRVAIITSDGVTIDTKVRELADVTTEKGPAAMEWVSADPSQLPFPTAGGQALAVSPDGNLLATGSAAAFTRDGRYVAVSPHPISIARPRSTNRTARVIDLATGTEIPLRARGDRVLALAFSLDGSYVATGSNEGASIYDAKTGEETSHFPPQRSVDRVVLSPDGLYIATADIDNNVHTFNVTTGGEVSRFSLDEPVRALAFIHKGRSLRVVSGSSTISYRDYSLVSEDLIIKACSQLQRNLTHEEWGRYLGNEAYRKTCPNLPDPPAERR